MGHKKTLSDTYLQILQKQQDIDKYNKIVDLQRGKAKKALSKFTNFAKNAKVTRLFFLAIEKDRVTNVARIARMTNSAKF